MLTKPVKRRPPAAFRYQYHHHQRGRGRTKQQSRPYSHRFAMLSCR